MSYNELHLEYGPADEGWDGHDGPVGEGEQQDLEPAEWGAGQHSACLTEIFLLFSPSVASIRYTDNLVAQTR